MPTSFLDLPLELRREIYKLIIPIQREASLERFFAIENLPIETDKTYWEELPPYLLFSRVPDVRLPEVSEAVLCLGSRLLRTCRQVSDEVAPYVYGQQQFRFYRPRQALQWLDRIGQYQIRLRHVAILVGFVPFETSEDNGEVQTHIWASVLRKLLNIESISCWSGTIWDKEVVLEALRDLVHIRAMSIGKDSKESSLELTLNKPSLETLVLTGHPVAGVEWYPEDYFDRLTALKHLTFWSALRMQSGNSKVSNDFFSHIAPLRSFTWHGFYLTNSHRKAFTTRHVYP